MTLSSGLRRGLFARPAPVFAGPYAIDAIGGAAPEAAYGMFPLKPGYNGYCIRVARDSDGAELDIGFDKGFLDVATLDIFLNGTAGAVSIWYDQSGHGRDATQPDAAYRMRLYPTNRIGAARAITADYTQNLLVPASVQCTGPTASMFALARSCGFGNLSNGVFSFNAKTAVAIASITKSGTTATVTSAGHGLSNGALIWIQGATDPLYNGRVTVANATTNTFDYTMTGTPAANAATATSLHWSQFSTDIGLHSFNGFTVTGNTYASAAGNQRVISSPSVMGFVGNGSGAKGTLHLNSETALNSRNAEIATTIQGGMIGPGELFTTANIAGHIEFGSVLIYDRTLSGGEISAGKAALYAVGAIDAGPTRQVAYVGDSITMGATIYGARPFSLLCEANYSRPAISLIMGQTGIQMAAIAADVGKLTPASMYKSAYAINAMHLLAGTNDLEAGASASTVYGNITSYVAAAKSAGFVIAVGTILPRATFTSPKETQRQALNALILANSAGADSTIDYGSLSALANTADTSIFTDGIHPTAAGHAVMAALASPAINALLV